MYRVIWDNRRIFGKPLDDVNTKDHATIKDAMDLVVLLMLLHFSPVVVKVIGNRIIKVL